MKKQNLSLPAIAMAMLLFAGCAGVDIVNVSDSNNKGIRVRMPEPYLLVTFPSEPDKLATAQIITLPTGDALTLTPHGGLGSASLKFELENGALKSWGLDTDSKIPETVTALTAVATALLAKPTEENTKSAQGKSTSNAPLPRVELYRITQNDSGGVILVRVTLPD